MYKYENEGMKRDRVSIVIITKTQNFQLNTFNNRMKKLMYQFVN
jgi:hypothetical protein